MTRFPNTPVSPREFFEDVIPSIFAELELDERAGAFELKLGIRLTGEGGGEWSLHFIEGELGIDDGLAADCALTIFQSVEDWRSGLWEGRPGLISDAVSQLAAGLEPDVRSTPGAAIPRNPEAFRELEKLPGRIDAIIAGDDQLDWRIGVGIGPGPISESPDATIRVGSAEAEAIRRGELHPVEALITGRLRLEGDLGLILQLQAIAMAASLPQSPGA